MICINNTLWTTGGFVLRLDLIDNMEVMLIGIAFLEVLLLPLKWNELPTILLAAEILRHSVKNAWISLLLAQESVCHVIFRFRNT